MFKKLQGNPTAISMIASIYQAEKFKFYQNANERDSDQILADIYERIYNEKLRKDEIYSKLTNGEELPRFQGNLLSLEVAAEMSVKLVENLPYPDDINLLYFLGCLPGGVTEVQLREMWGKA